MITTSIIIPTYKRKDSLVRLLKSLRKEVGKKEEIIVVEQGEKNNDIYEKIARTNHIRLRYVYRKDVSTSKAKNIGIKHAKGKYIIFYDDDIVPKQKSIRNLIANFSNPAVGGVCGRVLDKGKKPEFSRTDTGRISLLCTFSDGYSSNKRQEIDTVIGCNAGWRKDILEKVHGFDEHYTGNAMREESDLSLRVKKLGYYIVFDPKSEVLHIREQHGGARKIDDRFYWYFHFFSNETYFFLKHRSWILLPIFILTRWEYILRCCFGFGREVSVRSMMTPWGGIIDGVRKHNHLLLSFRT